MAPLYVTGASSGHLLGQQGHEFIHAGNPSLDQNFAVRNQGRRSLDAEPGNRGDVGHLEQVVLYAKFFGNQDPISENP